jgi:hypothetical protein
MAAADSSGYSVRAMAVPSWQAGDWQDVRCSSRGNMNEAKEVTIPTILLGIALAVFLGYGFYAAGVSGAGVVLIVVGIQVIIGVILGIIACVITARLMDISFGRLGTASLKLAAIFAFPAAVSLFIPFIGWLVALILYFILLTWLFDLEGREATVCAIVIWVVRMFAFYVGGLLLASMT